MLLLSNGSSRERGVEGRYNVTLCSYCLMVGEQREEWRARYNVKLYIYCLMAGELRVVRRGRYNVTLCSYCLMAGEQRKSGGEDLM